MQRGKGLIPDFRDMDVDNMLKTWNYVYRMYDIDVIVNGHGGTSSKEDILNNIQFVTTLRQAVLDEMVKGTSLGHARDHEATAVRRLARLSPVAAGGHRLHVGLSLSQTRAESWPVARCLAERGR